MKPIPNIIRAYVFMRDDGRCRICGQFTVKGVVHHIFRRSEAIPADLAIPWIKGNNHPDNLVWLCSVCHALLHAGLFNEDKALWVVENRRLRDLCPMPKEVQEWLIEHKVLL